MSFRYLNFILKVLKKNITIKEKIAIINYYERKYDFFSNINEGYVKWDYLRIIIARLANKVDKTIKKDLKDKILKNIFKDLFYFKNFKIFFYKQKTNIIFFGHNRGVLEKNYIKDEYLDDITKNFKEKKINVFSGSHFYYGSKYDYKDKRIFLNYLNFYLKIISFIKLCFCKVDLKILDNKKKLELIFQYEREKWWFNYFKKVKPKYVFFVSINSYLYIVRAANRLGIITLEIQHGTPNSKKVEYTYTFDPKKRLSSPIYFLGWGNFWKKYLNNLYFKKSFIRIGKNISNKIKKFNKKNTDILIIDQVIFRDELVKKAIDISKKFNLKIIYRFHPNIDFKKDATLKLKRNNIIVHHPKSNELSDSLKNVRFVIGVASTALLELAFNNYNVLVLPSEEFDYKILLSKKTFFGLKMIDNKLVKKNNVFCKPNLNMLKKIIK